MQVLEEGFFELDGFKFGGSDADGLWVSEYTIGQVKWSEDKFPGDQGGRTQFGASFPEGPEWTFLLSTKTGEVGSALDVLEEAAMIWRDTDKLSEPDNESVLRYTRGGRTRRVYGRPRKFIYDTNGFLREGSWDAEGTFVASDAWFYDDQMRSVTVNIVQPSTGGVAFPTVFPWTSEPGDTRIGVIDDVGGSRQAPFIAQINGPIQNPVVAGDGWKLALDTNLLYDQSAIIDTRTMMVLREDGSSLAGSLTYDSRLTNARLRPGKDEIRFSGVDSTGKANVTVAWRPTHYGM